MLFGATAIDAALDIEQRVDAPDRLQRDRGDRGCIPAAPRIVGNVGSKNWRLAWAQHSAGVIAPGVRDGL
jgi:hypothetical protein